MNLHSEMIRVVDESGLWSRGSRATHGFVLAPHVFELSAEQRIQLDRLARAIDECLGGLSRLVAISEDQSYYALLSTYPRIAKAMRHGTPYSLPNSRPKNLPILRKCDLLVDESGKIWIAEIDATNPRSWGYSVLGRNLANVVQPGSDMLPGVAPFIAQELKRRGMHDVTFLYGHTQRFYRPEFEVIASELKTHGITMVPVDEVDVVITQGQMIHARSGEVLPECLVDMPFMNSNPRLIEWLKQSVSQGDIDFLIPPKYFLGAKAALGILSNPTDDHLVDVLLRSQISSESLAVVRSHLPATYVVGKGWDAPQIDERSSWVLKQSVSSGMKNVFFSSEDDFKDSLGGAQRSKVVHVLQEEVVNRPYRWRAYDQAGETIAEQDYFLRLTAYMSRRGVEDISVTGCVDKRVHGGKQAIITGTIVVP